MGSGVALDIQTKILRKIEIKKIFVQFVRFVFKKNHSFTSN